MCDHQCCRRVVKQCATCALSTFVCGTSHQCNLGEYVVAEDFACEEWLPLVMNIAGRPPRVFGDLDEQPCN